MRSIGGRLTTPIKYSRDVLAVGGGVADIAAAMTDDMMIIDLAALQSTFVSRGVKLHIAEL